jgi:hypothetical protein
MSIFFVRVERMDHLIEPGIRDYFYGSFQQCKDYKMNYYTKLVNIGLFVLFVFILVGILYMKKKEKMTPQQKAKKNEDKLPSGDKNNDDDDWQKIVITLDVNGEYVVTNFCREIDDTLYGSHGYQTSEGDLMKFMKWYIERFPYSKTTMHIVAHSHIMQAFTEDYLDKTVSEDRTTENCWTITIPYYDKYTDLQRLKIMSSIKPGFKNPDKDSTILTIAQDQERATPDSLCGSSGSVDEIICPKRGGRRTRRKRSNRKKTRRHRRYSRHRR